MKSPATMMLLVLFAVCNAQAQERPESIIGTWQLDLIRTMTENLERMAAEQETAVDPAQVESMRALLGHESVQQQTQAAAVTITEDAIISSDPLMGPTRSAYKVIGGNAGLVIIEVVDHEGFESVGTIRLVDGGIAIEATDCRIYPEACARQQRRAMAGFKQSATGSADTNTAVAGTLAISSDCPDGACLDGAVETQGPTNQPQWVYFTRVEKNPP